MKLEKHYRHVDYDDIACTGSHTWVTKHIANSHKGLVEVIEHGAYDARSNVSVRNVTERKIGYREARRLIVNGRAPGAVDRLDQWDAERRGRRIEVSE